MPDQKTTASQTETAETKLVRLRELIVSARSMPMSASCVINRNEVLTAIDDAINHLPEELADAQEVIDASRAKVAEGEAEASTIVAEARARAEELAGENEVVKIAEGRAAELLAEARTEATELRREVDSFVDSRMATFESVLHKTTSQVRTARARLAERSGLNQPASDQPGSDQSPSPVS